MAKLVLQAAATSEPVSLEDAKAHLNETRSSEDATIARLITVATESLQHRYWTQFVTATYDQYFDSFADIGVLQRHPVDTVSSVKYTDIDGDEQTVSTSVWEQGDEHGRAVVRLAYNQTWPSDCRGHADSVVVRYTCGHGAATAVPAQIKQAILLMVADLYTFRESVKSARLVPIPGVVERLMTGQGYKGIV